MRLLAVLLAAFIVGCSGTPLQEENGQDTPVLGTRQSAMESSSLVCLGGYTTGCPGGYHVTEYVPNACPGSYSTTGLRCEPDSLQYTACGFRCGSFTHPTSFGYIPGCTPTVGNSTLINSVTCEENDRTFEMCGQGCPSKAYHIERFSWAPGCSTTSTSSSLTPNQTSCALNTGTRFTMCKRWYTDTCPLNYTVTSKNWEPSCDTHFPQSEPWNNQLTCEPAYPFPTALKLQSPVRGGETFSGTVTLSNSFPTSHPVRLMSNNPHVALVQPEVWLPAGVNHWTFDVKTSVVSQATEVTITAQIGVFEQHQTITVSPPVPVHSMSVPSIGPGTVGTITATLSLVESAPPGGSAVTLSSSNPDVARVWPSSVVPGDESQTPFTVTLSPVLTDTVVTLSATTPGGPAQTVTLPVRALPAPPPGTRGPAIFQDDGCNAHVGGSTSPVPLPFPLNFHGRTFNSLFVNANGSVSFDNPSSWPVSRWYLRVGLEPIIELFHTPSSGGNVSYGNVTFAGRNALCVNWFDMTSDIAPGLNSFQLLLVERGDVQAGDFDIYMNYSRLEWDCSSTPWGCPLGYVTAGWFAGQQYDGHGGYDPYSPNGPYFVFPGSGKENLFPPYPAYAFLDTVLSPYSLSRTRHNSPVPGRHFFPIRNTGGRISGHVTDSASKGVPWAPVQVCPAAGGPCAAKVISDDKGFYVAEGLPEGDYTVTAFAPFGSNGLTQTSEPKHVAPKSALTVNITLRPAIALPPETSLTPSKRGDNGMLIVDSHDPLDLSVIGCERGTASYKVMAGTTVLASGPMSEVVAGAYSAQLLPLYSGKGQAQVVIDIGCPSVLPLRRTFDIYIAPSGTVRTLHGKPLRDARVTLYSADNPAGPFTVVPAGSSLMSPVNRTNPDVTTVDGRFGWDLIAGYYVVRAERAGCVSPTGAPYVESPVLTIPPSFTGLDLRLACPELDDTTPPISSAIISGDPNGWSTTPVQVQLTATDDSSGVAGLLYSLAGAQSDGGLVYGTSAEFRIDADGVTTLSWNAYDVEGNLEEPHSRQVRVDQKPPSSSASALPQANAEGWNNTPVTIQIEATDQGSGVSEIVYTLSGAQTGGATVSGHSASVTIDTEGKTTLSWYTRDRVGHQEDPHSLDIHIDMTPPALSCAATPAVIFPPNHKLIPVQINLHMDDARSGSEGSTLLTEVKSSEPSVGDIQEWEPGTADTQGLLRATRSASGPGRTYTLSYEGSDRAGNVATCAATVTVPHDQRP
jgi:hypothetical protein